MNSIISALYSGNMAQLSAKATQSSNARAEYISVQKDEDEAQSAALNTSLETQTTNAQAIQPIEQLQKAEQAKTNFLTQQIAQAQDDTEETTDRYAALADEFQAYMDKTPEERYFEAFLKEQGMTQEEFDALSPEDKQKLLKKFEDFVKQKLEEAESKKHLEEQDDKQTF